MSADSAGLVRDVEKVSHLENTLLRNRFIGDKGLLYLFIGRISVLKGVPHLLKAWEQHTVYFPEDRLILVGKGDMLSKLAKDYAQCDTVFLKVLYHILACTYIMQYPMSLFFRL